ncbi:MAG: GHKL domain-containing protein [Lewinellaceae bacterium]|nr:GHKL domain-containing protein [Saprospiraceae bacterium]MCB9337525.1 GHKL domain-containing protein [Lewinellaceae bacterium]
MHPVEKTPALIEQIRHFEAFQNLPDSDLEWLVERSEYGVYKEGENLFYPHKPVEHMQVIVDGEYVTRFQQGNELNELGTWGTGYITGLLPFSRMKEAMAYGIALRDTYVLELHKKHFTEMVGVSYEMTQNLVAQMSNRIRDFTHIRLQNEKLMSLGKLSAGLAHELNNPASSIVRNVEELYSRTHQTPERFKRVVSMRLTSEQTDAVNAILFSKIGVKRPELTLMQRESMKDDLLDWLEDRNVGNAEVLAETFVEFGMTEDDLDKIHDIVNGQDMDGILPWLESTLSMEQLVGEIREASGRIASLIKSIKSYTHMDRAKDGELIDIQEGIANTLTILKHQLKNKSIEVQKDFGENLPKILAFPGELNQVWTNILDNAIDAMDEGGILNIKTYDKRDRVFVEITDNGPGIPAEVVDKIFDPFFTTKGIGKGTGLGLEVVHRIVDHHKGNIEVDSVPGKTTFTVCFPVK